MKLDQLKADYGRYLAIKERQKKDSLHGMLEAFELKDEFVAALPGLLRACDVCKELLIAMKQRDGFTYERSREMAEKKLEELLG